MIIVDESTDARIVEALDNLGYTTFSIQQQMQGINDQEVIRIAAEKNGYILTEDKDFGDEIVFKHAVNNGAMLLRLAGMPIDNKIKLVTAALNKYHTELIGGFAVLNKNKLRLRK